MPQDLVNNYLTVEQIEELKKIPEALDEKGCYGAHVMKVLIWISEHGCVIEDMCPFVGRRQEHTIDRKPKYRFEKFRLVASKYMQKEVKNQPIITQLITTCELANLHTNEI